MNAAKKAYETVCHIDEEERNRLLLEQLPQVRYIARRIHDRLPQSVCLEDLVHAGVLGLIDALAKYDPAKNVQLKSYAKFRIRGAILDSLRGLDWSPRDLRRKASPNSPKRWRWNSTSSTLSCATCADSISAA